MRLQVPNKEEMAWRRGARPAPLATELHRPQALTHSFGFGDTIQTQAPSRTGERRSGAWMQGLDHSEQRQHLQFELGSSPKGASKAPSDASKEPKLLGGNYLRTWWLRELALRKPDAFPPRPGLIFRPGRELFARSDGRKEPTRTNHPIPSCLLRTDSFSSFLKQLFNTNPSLCPPQSYCNLLHQCHDRTASACADSITQTLSFDLSLIYTVRNSGKDPAAFHKPGEPTQPLKVLLNPYDKGLGGVLGGWGYTSSRAKLVDPHPRPSTSPAGELFKMFGIL